MRSPEKDNNLPLQNLQELSCLSSSPLNFNRYLLRLHLVSFTCLLQYLIRLFFISYTSMLLKMHKYLTHILQFVSFNLYVPKVRIIDKLSLLISNQSACLLQVFKTCMHTFRRRLLYNLRL